MFDSTPQPVDLEGLNIENVVAYEIRGIVHGLQLQGVPEGLLEASWIERESRRRQGPERFRHEIGRAREGVVDFDIPGTQCVADGMPLQRLDLVVADGSEDVTLRQRSLGNEPRFADLLASRCR